MANHYHSEGFHLDLPPGDYDAGTLVQVGGVVGIVNHDFKQDGSTGFKKAAATVVGTVKLDNSGVSFSDGDKVGYDATANNAVAAGGGDFNCGMAVGAAGATEQVVVLLNAIPTAAGV